MLLSEETRATLAKYFPCCAECGLPMVEKTENICPVCGSTTWGWQGTRWYVVVGILVAGLVSGEAAMELARVFGMGGKDLSPIALGFMIAAFMAPLVSVLTRKRGDSGDGKQGLWLILGGLMPLLLYYMHTCHIPAPSLPHYCGMIWLGAIYDSFLYYKRRSPSLDQVITTVAEKQVRLRENLARIDREVQRLGIGRKTQAILEIRDKLKKSHDLVVTEITELEFDEAYSVALRVFFFWKNCLMNIYTSIGRIPPADLDAIEEINKGLRMDIFEARQIIREAIPRGRRNAMEIDEFIEHTLEIHERIREIITARRASHVLAEVDLAMDYEAPNKPAPMQIKLVDCTSGLLDEVNQRFHKIRLDSDVNRIFRS